MKDPKSLNLEEIIQRELNILIPNHPIKEAYFWAMFPAGKLFRPNLALAVCQDLNPVLYNETISLKNKDMIYLACALECHHSYSLVHDDLPSMDNDDFRRNKESTHKKYGEWKAILIGDGLLNISYQFLSKIKKTNPERVLELIKVFSHSMGPKGLIHGQTLDLSNEMKLNFYNTVLTHKLKTARLIQVSILGGTYLAIPKNRKIEKILWKLGEDIGIIFQLLDDLSELSERNLSKHEKEINPWLIQPNEALIETEFRILSLLKILEFMNMVNTNKILSNYFEKMNLTFLENIENINLNINCEIDLNPMMKALERLCLLYKIT